jgi:signal transduction histidine kinase/DNA-binding response OmpR family regulator
VNSEKILVVDDNYQITDFLAGELLPGLGYETLVAHNGRKAQELVKAHQPDLVLLDFQLPDTTGLELLRRLTREGHNVPAILITAEGSEQIAVDALRLGVQDYFIKPVDADSLNIAITRALTETRLRRERARLAAQLEQQVTWLTVLSKVGKSVTATLELDEVLRRIVEVSVYLTQADEGFLALLDDGSGQLYLRAAKNLGQGESKTMHQPVSDPLANRVVQTGRPIRISQAAQGRPLKVSTGLLVHSLIQVPVLSKDRVRGVLSVDNHRSKREFIETDEMMLMSLADYAAVAIENACLYQQAQQEIKERMRAEEVLQTYAAKLEQSNRELESFAYVVSHDLQEPLRKVLILGDRLQAKWGQALNAQGRDYLERMQSAAGRMQTLIDDLLTYSRVATKAQPFVPVDLTQAAREVVSDLEARIEQVGGQVEIEELPTIQADPTQMRQLLQNLVGNALKFHRKGVPPVVKVHAQLLNGQGEYLVAEGTTAERCRIIVEDNGIGFDEKHLDRIFQVFQRLHSRSEYEGTGIGLATCRKIVERHGGSVTAQSAPGQGATFVATLPFRQPSREERS